MSSGAIACAMRHCIIQPVQRSRSWGSTNLSLSKDRDEEIPDWRTQCRNNKQRAHSVKCTRLDEHGDDGFVQPTNSTWSHRGSANVPGVQDEPGDDQEGEENVE